MAQSSTVLGEMPFGNKRITYGTFTNTSTEQTASIKTGLTIVEAFDVTPYGSSVTGNACTVNATFPVHSASSTTSEVTVAIACDAGIDGCWRALGV